MKQVILRNWDLIRFLRLVMGLAIIVQAVIIKDPMFGMAGLLFTGMAVFNLGCCNAGNCKAPPVKKDPASKEIHYEEVV